MLPFLKKAKEAPAVGIIVKTRTPDEKPEQEEPSLQEDLAQDLIEAVHAKDAKSVVEAAKALFQSFDKEPHEEGEHIEPHSYDASKE